MFEGRNLNALHPAAYLVGAQNAEQITDQYEIQRLMLARSVVNTALAKVAGKQKPKTQFCVNETDWQTKRKARKLERFVEAVMHARQGQYDNAWSAGNMSFRDCLIGDAGVLKVWPDTQAKRIQIERRLPWEVFFDPAEMKHGQPQNIFDTYGFDRDKLAATYPKHEADIMAAPSLSESSRGQEDMWTFGDEAGRQILVYEAYRLPLSDKKPGHHAMCIGGPAGVDLLDGEGEWSQSDFPYLWFVWEPWTIGCYGTSIVDVIFHLATDANSSIERWGTAERLCANGVVFFEEGSIDPKDLDSNEIGIRIPYRKGAERPTFVAPDAVSTSSKEFLQLVQRGVYEMSGVSLASATSQKPAGVTADVAIRTVQSLETERFAVPWQMYENKMSVGLARKIVACAKDIADEEGADFSVQWVNDGSAREIRWSDVRDLELPDEAYQPAAVSGLVNTPTDRLQLASELHDRQLITDETYLEVIQVKGVASELERANEISRWIDKQIDAWLDYEPGDEDKDERPFRYRPPIKYIGIPGLTECIVRVGRAYLHEDSDDCPEYKLRWFTQFMGDADTEIQKLRELDARLQSMSTSQIGASSQPPPGGAPQPPPAQGAM